MSTLHSSLLIPESLRVQYHTAFPCLLYQFSNIFAKNITHSDNSEQADYIITQQWAISSENELKTN
jgi:hypothetical protein